MTTDVSPAVDRVALAHRFADEVWNAGDFRLIDEYVDANFVSHDPAPEDVRTREAMKQFVAAQREGFPDFRLEILEVLEHGDKAVTRWRASGTHRGSYMGLAPTGRRAAVEGITIERWAGGRIVEAWVAYDVLTVMQQLGVLPAPGSRRERVGKGLQRAAVRGRRLGAQGSAWVRERRRRAPSSG